MKDPFEAAVEEQDSPPESPAPPEEEAGAAGPADDPEDYDGDPRAPPPRQPAAPASLAAAAAKAKVRVQREQQEDEDDDEDQMEVDLEKLPTSTGDPDKLAKMKFVPDYAFPVQYFRISSRFRRLVSGRNSVVMTERKDSGPIRPCHIREAYRRLKLEGKIPRRSVPRLFR
ncbi:hypothetical protein BAE44_0020309 [Dichanthelium oligosanthes]|uniref:TAFII28-like protein domain-containing protein n=1 Tax=Dichanthelium oligosanthes TaxID=888268 RepID=A0A1E5V0M9_9POAL|nr:hypothetical protein BAE44_0020309 [Dichanthelium oligosanthes]